MDALRLESRGWIWPFLVAAEAVKVKGPGLHLVNNSPVIALLVPLQLDHRLSRRDNPHFHLVHKWRPDGEAAAPFPQVVGTQAFLPVQGLSSPLLATKAT